MPSSEWVAGGKENVAFPEILFNPGAMSLMQLTPAHFRRAAALKERLEKLEAELRGLLAAAPAQTKKNLHWTQTPEGKARLARSMRKSWQKRGEGTAPPKTASSPGKKLHWTQTPEGQVKMAEIRRRRWQKR